MSLLPCPRLLLSLFLLACPVLKAASLRDAAQTLAADLPAGCIVTGEFRQGQAEYAIAGKPEPADVRPEDLLFEMGSITKTFTGLLLAQAVVEGKVRLESTLAELLGPKQVFADPRVGAITLVQLSTHTSGLPRLPWNMDLIFNTRDPYAKYDVAKMLEFLSLVKLADTPTFPCSYSNYGVGLLGTLLSRVYGQSWESLVLEKICQPLGLQDTRLDITHSAKRLAPPYQGEKPASSWNFDTMAPAGGLRTTVVDLIKYGQAILHPEKTPLKAAFALALKPHASVASGPGKVGLGWFIHARGDLHWFIHSGATGSYGAILEVVPAREVIHVVLINNSEQKPEAVLQAAARLRAPKGDQRPAR